MKNNTKVRECLDEYGVRQWELADRCEVSEQTMFRWLRKERPEEIQDLLCDVIKGNSESVEKLKTYFRKKSLSEDETILNMAVEEICREVSEREFEMELEREQERESWLYEGRRRK